MATRKVDLSELAPGAAYHDPASLEDYAAQQQYDRINARLEARAEAAKNAQPLSAASLRNSHKHNDDVAEDSITATIQDSKSLTIAAAMMGSRDSTGKTLFQKVENLAADTPVSLFVPSDKAFKSLDHDIQKSLLGKGAVKAQAQLMRQHIAPAAFEADERGEHRLTMEPNRNIGVRQHPDERGSEVRSLAVLFDDNTGEPLASARILKTIDLTNGAGRIHVIDAPLLPEDA